MYQQDKDTAQISFQWAVGDMRAHEKNISELIRSKSAYAITVVSRLAAYGLTFVVANALLPNVDFFTVFWIAVFASLSIWASVGLEFVSLRMLERFQADDPRRVGWNSIWLDSSGITWSTETTEDYTSWLGVIDVVERDGSLWLKTGQVHGYYIPSGAFDSLIEMANCRELIQKLQEHPLPPRHLLGAGENLVKH